jgi:hypothetical protein
MNNFSTTQATNIASIVGMLVLILNHFNINIASEELTNIIGAGVTIFGIVSNWIHRYQKGDLTLGGIRKY